MIDVLPQMRLQNEYQNQVGDGAVSGWKEVLEDIYCWCITGRRNSRNSPSMVVITPDSPPNQRAKKMS